MCHHITPFTVRALWLESRYFFWIGTGILNAHPLSVVINQSLRLYPVHCPGKRRMYCRRKDVLCGKLIRKWDIWDAVYGKLIRKWDIWDAVYGMYFRKWDTWDVLMLSEPYFRKRRILQAASLKMSFPCCSTSWDDLH